MYPTLPYLSNLVLFPSPVCERQRHSTAVARQQHGVPIVPTSQCSPGSPGHTGRHTKLRRRWLQLTDHPVPSLIYLPFVLLTPYPPLHQGQG